MACFKTTQHQPLLFYCVHTSTHTQREQSQRWRGHTELPSGQWSSLEREAERGWRVGETQTRLWPSPVASPLQTPLGVTQLWTKFSPSSPRPDVLVEKVENKLFHCICHPAKSTKRRVEANRVLAMIRARMPVQWHSCKDRNDSVFL